jgi:uncharacterized repeat protein (TIGR03833 family)
MSSHKAFNPRCHTDAPTFAPTIHPRASDDIISHFMALTATHDPAAGELPPLSPSACNHSRVSSAAAARFVLEAAGGDLGLAFELQSWRHQQQLEQPSKLNPPIPHHVSFLDAARGSDPLPKQPQATFVAVPGSYQQFDTGATDPFPASAQDARTSKHGNGRRMRGRTAACGSAACSSSACCSSGIQPGTAVSIVEKQNQRSGVITRGIVSRVLTGSAVHPRGIKVQLACGAVGRIQSFS